MQYLSVKLLLSCVIVSFFAEFEVFAQEKILDGEVTKISAKDGIESVMVSQGALVVFSVQGGSYPGGMISGLKVEIHGDAVAKMGVWNVPAITQEGRRAIGGVDISAFLKATRAGVAMVSITPQGDVSDELAETKVLKVIVSDPTISNADEGQPVPIAPDLYYMIYCEKDQARFLTTASRPDTDPNGSDQLGLKATQLAGKFAGRTRADSMWKIVPIENSPGYFRLTTKKIWDSGALSYLDTYNSENYEYFFADGNAPITTGQEWKFVPIEGSPGAFRITNRFLEGNRCIDISDLDGIADASDIAPGQVFKLLPVEHSPR